MNEEPTKNEQEDQSFLNRRSSNVRSRQKPEAINAETEQAKPAKGGPGKKQILSFEEIIAEQQTTKDIDIADSVADIGTDNRIDPLESLNELKSALSKTHAVLSSEEIDGLLGVQRTDEIEEGHETNEASDAGGGDAKDEMDALTSLKAAIEQAQSQLDHDDINDDDQGDTGSFQIGSDGDEQLHAGPFHIGNDGDEQPSMTPETEKNAPASQIPSFELSKKILTEERKTAAGRRTRNSENTQKSDRSDITGILGEIVRADRKVKSEPVESYAIAENIAGDGYEDLQEQSSLSDVNDRYTPAVYSILRGDNNLTQIQHMIIADIVARDLAKQCP